MLFRSALWNCAANNPANRDAMRNAGGIGVLVGLARDGTDAQKENAAGALRSCAVDNPANRDAVRDAGGIGVLVGLARDGTEAQKVPAAKALVRVGLEPAELGGLTVPVLKGLCAEFGLSKTGVKADLVVRLCPKLCSDGPPRKKLRMDLEVRTLLLNAAPRFDAQQQPALGVHVPRM